VTRAHNRVRIRAMRDEPTGEPAEDTSWDQRRLCPDGGCVGVVGPGGACTTCGKVDPEARIGAAEASEASGAGDVGDDDDDVAGDDDSDDPSSAATAAEPGDEWQRRRLCEDGACIGLVIDGRCNTCGTKQ
jgi:hypothetical protein